MRQSRSWRFQKGLGMVLLASLAGACGADMDLLEPCEVCVGECDLEPGFDFEGYEFGAMESDLCLSAYESEDCRDPEFSILEATIAETQTALFTGEITCEWLIYRHIERALQYDLRVISGRPPLNSMIHLNAEALVTARRLDNYLRNEGELAGPLHCVPFTIKGNYASREVPTTAGSLAIGEAQANFDAFTVEQFRRAGAVMIGSAAMDEFAKGLGGYSSRSGKIGNPYNTSLISGGSSGGSAVSVAANFAMVSMGTDNCSSLTLPSAYNGLVTIRSSHGLVSVDGIFPLNRLNQTAGPMARTVEDLARSLDVMAERNPEDRAHCEAAPPRPQTFQAYLNADGLQGKRIGILRELTDEASDRQRAPFAGATDAMNTRYQSFFAELDALGAEVIDNVALPEVEDRLYSSGYGYDIDRFLERTTGATSQNVEELCNSRLFSFSIYDSVENCLSRLTQTARQLATNIQRGTSRYEANRAYVESVLDSLELDALVYPVDPRGGARSSSVSSNCVLSSYTGLPTITVNAGHDANNMPFGMMFTGRMYDEPTLFEIAYSYEQGTLHRRVPDFQPYQDPPPLDVATFNQIHRLFGEVAFAEVLGHTNRWELSANLFRELATAILEEAGLEKLID